MFAAFFLQLQNRPQTTSFIRYRLHHHPIVFAKPLLINTQLLSASRAPELPESGQNHTKPQSTLPFLTNAFGTREKEEEKNVGTFACLVLMLPPRYNWHQWILRSLLHILPFHPRPNFGVLRRGPDRTCVPVRHLTSIRLRHTTSWAGNDKPGVPWRSRSMSSA